MQPQCLVKVGNHVMSEGIQCSRSVECDVSGSALFGLFDMAHGRVCVIDLS